MRVLITAGQVYGKLDDNKLVGNRTRGIWAIRFAEYLLDQGHDVVLLIPDIMSKSSFQMLEIPRYYDRFEVLTHDGFWKYKEICEDQALKVDAAVMASAVVNWIPENPFPGKMPTDSDRMMIEFILAPRVINEMKKINPRLTLIGCKMLIGSEYDQLVNAAYKVILDSKANLVLANDMKNGLRTKYLVYQDRSVFKYENDFDSLYEAMEETIKDRYYRTEMEKGNPNDDANIAKELVKLDAMINFHVKDFLMAYNNDHDIGMIFGAIAVKTDEGWIVTGRKKSLETVHGDYGIVSNVDFENGIVKVSQNKVSLNAPLLIRTGEAFGSKMVIHFHEQLQGVPTVSYAPPGTFRDNNREIPGPVFNIEGHGYVKAL